MAALFFDIDGTVVHYHTNKWLPGAYDKLCDLARQGHEIIFVTMRGKQDQDQEWNVPNTQRLLAQLPFQYQLIHSLSQPRVLIDDGTPKVFPTRTDSASWVKAL